MLCKIALKVSMKYCLCTGFLLITSFFFAQDSAPFGREVSEIVKRNDSLWDSSRETIVFTGSSSIRFWKDLQERFPENQVLNAGFGGSQASDLLYHLNDLVLRYEPKKVFVYEGDNDIFSKKSPRKILHTTQSIVENLLKSDGEREVVLISAKPSISRWKLRGKYRRLNRKLAKCAMNTQQVDFVDGWSPMLNGRKVKTDIFVEDGLHMNGRGYEIWYNALKEFVD